MAFLQRNHTKFSLNRETITFFEKRKTGGHNEAQQRYHRPTLIETSAVSPIAIIMFCNNGNVLVKHRESIVTVDGWLNLSVPPKTAVLLRVLRKQLEVVLREFASAPKKARNDPYHCRVIDLVAELLASEHIEAVPQRPHLTTTFRGGLSSTHS